MTDYFALLQQPRRPWLDADTLKQSFLSLSAGSHPDRIHSAPETEKAEAAKQFAGYNSAYQCLLNPKSRLLHLLELEAGAKPKEIQAIPTGLADVFAEVATACKTADGTLAEKKKNQSPLLAVQWFERGQVEVERLEGVQRRLNGLRKQLDDRLKNVDDAWTKADEAGRRRLLPELEELYRLFSYFNRWDGQIRERQVQLSL